jgi:hypothetical protein
MRPKGALSSHEHDQFHSLKPCSFVNRALTNRLPGGYRKEFP